MSHVGQDAKVQATEVQDVGVHEVQDVRIQDKKDDTNQEDSQADRGQLLSQKRTESECEL
ncbi:hypothetical protein BGX28_003894, partial [Mortierella sp. GBA30]